MVGLEKAFRQLYKLSPLEATWSNDYQSSKEERKLNSAISSHRPFPIINTVYQIPT